MNSRIGIIVLLTLTIGTSGCINNSTEQRISDVSDTADAETVEWATCEDIQIQIDQISDPTTIRQINDDPIGKVNIKWIFENNGSTTKALNLSKKGLKRFIEIERSSAVEKVEITPARCPKTSFSSK